MAKATKKEMKKEALRYMELLEIDEDIRRGFEENGTLYVSYAEGLVEPASDFEIHQAKAVEKAYGGMIYHIVRNEAFGEDMLTFLHVPGGKQEWEHYISRLGSGEFLTYGYVESPFEQAYGSVVIAPSALGPGVVRKG